MNEQGKQHRFRLTEENLNYLKAQAQDSGEAISRILNTLINEARGSQQEKLDDKHNNNNS